MKKCLASRCLLRTFLHALVLCTVSASEFQLEGDYLIGGLFDIHLSDPVHYDRPEVIDCSSQTFILQSYRRFQLMRFSVEEINNSTNLLPNVSLGYEIFDHCSDTHSFAGVLKLLSVNGLIQPWSEPHKNLSKVSKVVAVVGPFSSTDTLTLAPLFMVDLVPLVSYGATSSALSEKVKFPSFLRTVHSTKDMIEVIFNIILHFNWRWVAFLNSDNAYGKDGQEVFIKRIKDTEICLAYTKDLNNNTNYSLMFKQIEAQGITVIIVLASKRTAENVIESAIQLNVTNKVWVAGDTWSLSNKLRKEDGIKNIGTVLGVSQPVVTIPGFSDFIYSSKIQTHCEISGQQEFCNQVCNCSNRSAEEILDVDPSYSFSVYSAVYAIAHALHNALQCGVDKCNVNITLYPYMVLAELKKSNFTLLNQSIWFDENGDPNYGSYSIVFWNHSGDAEKIGFYKFHPSANFFINTTKIQWYRNGEVPTSLCSQECLEGYSKEQNGIHKCCFNCQICQNGSYINSTDDRVWLLSMVEVPVEQSIRSLPDDMKHVVSCLQWREAKYCSSEHNAHIATTQKWIKMDDPYVCIECKETEWSAEGSTSCTQRVVEYIPFTDSGAILIMVGALALVGLTLAISALFAINYNTPVVRSAGGPMCFLILGCLSLCSLSVFFYFAAKFPKLHIYWMKYHGQWLVITVAFVAQALLLVIGYTYDTPKTYNESLWYPDKIILGCDISLKASSVSVVLLSCLCSLCFIFSYMGKDLPKNYNEAKAITFCLLLLILTWIIFATVYVLYRGKYIPTLNSLAVLFSLYSFLLFYFLPKCYIIVFQSYKNTQEYFQGLIQNYTKTISQ